MSSENNEGKTIKVNWFEIPVSDFDRAKTFYQTIFDVQIQVHDMGNFKMGVFPHSDSGGAICWGEAYQPGSNGVVVYLDANPDLGVVQGRIEEAGGTVLQAKKQISPEHGFMALFNDTEGNRLALHSME